MEWTKEMEAEARKMYEKLASEPSTIPDRKTPPQGYVWVRTIPGGAGRLEKQSVVLERIKRAGGNVDQAKELFKKINARKV